MTYHLPWIYVNVGELFLLPLLCMLLCFCHIHHLSLGILSIVLKVQTMEAKGSKCNEGWLIY